MRQKYWWLAGIAGLLACLLRPNGIFLFLPFCFEYLRQHHFSWRAIRWDVLYAGLIPVGLLIYGLYCYHHYGDFLAFSHGQQSWKRTTQLPWVGLYRDMEAIIAKHTYLRDFLSHSLDLFPDLLAFFLIGLSAVGFCRLGNRHWSYVLYGASLWIFANCFPAGFERPLLGTGRNMLIIFPLFLILAQLGRFRWIHLLYLSIAVPLCFFWCFQFIVGYPAF
ncbi:hypothetical protein [Dictyobacter arantiisoli]|uniref:hypothetical protein n=1 Tax=Dictyobacter arantiisoli TaxID=2014874 RepID=UPI0011F07C77|nr:hypothetical protein [Dictyobacter arantiisoli]